MRALSNHELLEYWEWGQAQSSTRRALGLLAAAFPGVSAGLFEAVSVGRRDRALLSVREALFGRTLHSLADCPSCRQAVELTLDTAELGVGDESDFPAGPAPQQPPVVAEGIEVHWRLPDSRDLMAVESALDVDDARGRLLRRTILAARRGEQPLDVAALPAGVLSAVFAAMDESDPHARIEFALTCPGCDHAWVATLDTPAFVWREIETLARRLLQEVHTLASAYRWREADILAMGERRRWAYLEILGR